MNKGAYTTLFPPIIKTTSFVTFYILHLFNKKPVYYGKELSDAIIDRFNTRWKPSNGIIYPLLRKLEETELLKMSYDYDDCHNKSKFYYTITEKGREEYLNLLDLLKPKFIDSYNMMVIILNDFYNHKHDLHVI
jgi:DNA-binding PadR family transcriptional regulator